MKKLSWSVLGVSIFAMMPVIAGAAGTYYDGSSYRSSQAYGNNRGGYYSTYGAGRGYGQSQTTVSRNTTTRVTKKASATQKSGQVKSAKKGFHLGATLSHEFANWDFELKSAGSKLRYDGLAWNIVSADAAYYFDTSVPVQVNFGARYGKQSGETSMIDDDITRGGYGYEDHYDASNNYLGRTTGYAMSLGTSDGGTQWGFNAGIGLTDVFSVGRVKMTPSIGYRYFKHELTTKSNSGLTMDVFVGNSNLVNCINVNGEVQCDPYVGFVESNGDITATGRLNAQAEYIEIPAGSFVGVTLGDTYYYSQAGTSHKYETEWAGPYVALDMEYAINNNNFVNAGIELGLPMYDSKGDQPYRIDWAHPTSVEDKADLGKAYHLGMNAMWSTALSESVMLSLGMTYDYYKVDGADATTYLNPSWYQNLLDIAIANRDAAAAASDTDAQIYYQNIVNELNGYKSNGWKIETKDEIKSIYSAMGVRLGVSVKF